MVRVSGSGVPARPQDPDGNLGASGQSLSGALPRARGSPWASPTSIKRLARKSDIQTTTIPPNRLKDLHEALRPVTVGGLKGIALYGTGEAAELAYATLKEIGPDPMGRRA